MNPDTGAIAHFESEEDAKRAGHTTQLSKAEARVLLNTRRGERVESHACFMNRKERRKSAKIARRKNR